MKRTLLDSAGQAINAEVNGQKMRGHIRANLINIAVQAPVYQRVSSLEAGAGAGQPGVEYFKQLTGYKNSGKLDLDQLNRQTGEIFDNSLIWMGEDLMSDILRACVRDGYFPEKEFKAYEERKKARRAACPQAHPDTDANQSERK